MDTSHAPAPLPLPTAVSQVLTSYRPRTLTEPQWTARRAEVIELVAAAPPADEADVRALLGSAVALLAWAAPQVADLRLVDVLTGPWVERFAVAWRQEGRSDNSLRNHLAALHRLQRTLAGEDGSRRINRTDRSGPRTAAPYGDIEFSAVRAAAEHAPRHLADAIGTALTLHEQGIVAPDAFDHGLDPAAWSEAKRWMREHRLPPLDATQLRRAWAFTVVQSTSLLEAMRAGLRSDEIDGLRDHLPADGNASRDALRSF
ncbi:hypothetical protein [Egicoccus sp. AB-alg2]|uniref:hypothetical protein n=1 Tax=Egicoccus sp. AB-alg2 TaxID=3242693 RepID=UPI00359F02B4